MKRLNSGDSNAFSFTHKEFATLGWIAIVFLLILLIVVRRSRLAKEQAASQRRFDEHVDRLGLSGQEKSIVEAIYRCSGVKHKDSIFTSRIRFEEGLRHVMRDVFSLGHSFTERKKFHKTIMELRNKLGFSKNNPDAGLNNQLGREKTTHQIPVGTTLSICLPDSQSQSWIDAEVIRNEEYEICLRPHCSVSCKPGDLWKVRYTKASVVWEFTSITMNYSVQELELNHSEDVRYFERHYFDRIFLEQPAKIALFPTIQKSQSQCNLDINFFPSTIKEIAGTGLKVVTDMAVSIRQRVLMVFTLGPDCVIRDVGEIRDIREDNSGCSIIVELIGLNTKELKELMGIAQRVASDMMSEKPEMSEQVSGSY